VFTSVVLVFASFCYLVVHQPHCARDPDKQRTGTMLLRDHLRRRAA
jgi:hypothetical protein